MADHTTSTVPVGIDLGTTNTAVAIVDATGRTQILTNELGEALLPSVVYFQDSTWVVGREALKALKFDPTSVADGPKRDLGAPAYRRPIRGNWIPPEVLQACILREVHRNLRQVLPGEYRVVISVPAYFDDCRRRATLLAADMAEVPVLELVNEPTAAGMAFAEFHGYLRPSDGQRQPLRLLVYDLGGGTFDATVLEIRQGLVHILATDGDVHLGGQDWDRRLVDFLAQKFEGRFHLDPRDDPASLARLELQARETREALSARKSASVTVEFQNQKREVHLTRDQLEFLTADLLERTMHTVQELIRSCGLNWKQIDRVLLVGGTTRMPGVARRLREISGQLPDQSVNPDEAVARGAAIYAALRQMPSDDHTWGMHARIIDVAAHSWGMEGVDPVTGRKENKVLIPRNTPLPACIVEPFTTRWENQQSIVIKVLQGESTEPRECALIGHAILDVLPPDIRRGHPVQVIYDLRDNEYLQVRVRVAGIEREMVLEFVRTTTATEGALEHWKSVLRGSGRFATFEDALRQVLGVQVERQGACPHPPRTRNLDQGELVIPGDPSPRSERTDATISERGSRVLPPPVVSPSGQSREAMDQRQTRKTSWIKLACGLAVLALVLAGLLWQVYRYVF